MEQEKSANQLQSSEFVDINSNTLKPIIVEEFPLKNIIPKARYKFSRKITRQVASFTHGIHTYPAKFIPHIPRWGINYIGLSNGETLLDPFCGSGTTLVEGRLKGINVFGCEVNPLGILLSKAKATPLFITKNQFHEIRDTVNHAIRNIEIEPTYFDDIKKYLHGKWNFWFSKNSIEEIATILHYIDNISFKFLTDIQNDILRNYLKAVLSSVIKKVSYFNEEQIKVRKKYDKFPNGIPHTQDIFLSYFNSQFNKYIKFCELCQKYPDAEVKILSDDARNTHLPENSIDGIITSPPYINAIDYPMAHKYNLFLLKLISAKDYRQHCLNYIGITERAIDVKTYSELKKTGIEFVDDYIRKIYYSYNSSNTSKNRAYVVYQYFDQMKVAFEEFYRVLKSGGKAIFVVGDNNIRGIYVPTHKLLLKIAELIGFSVDIYFYHVIHSRKLNVNRNKNAGIIKEEMIFVIEK